MARGWERDREPLRCLVRGVSRSCKAPRDCSLPLLEPSSECVSYSSRTSGATGTSPDAEVSVVDRTLAENPRGWRPLRPWTMEREVIEQSRKHNECYAERHQRPGQPCGAALAHPIGSSALLFACPFCHDTTLQHHRLLNVTKGVTSVVFLSREERTSDDSPAKKVSDVCLYSRNRQRIFRVGVQVRGSATHFSRPTPTTLALGNDSVSAYRARGFSPQRIFIHCSDILY